MKNTLGAVILIKSSILIVLIFFSCGQNNTNKIFQSHWLADVHRTWIGPDYWSNPLQDWEIKDGKLNCLVSDYNRNVVLLTREIIDIPGTLSLGVKLGIINSDVLQKKGWAGFRLGIKGQFNDYRDAAVHGWGINAGLTTNGQLFIGKWNETSLDETNTTSLKILIDGRAQLKLLVEQKENDYSLELSFWSDDQKIDSVQKEGFKVEELNGLLALVVDFPGPSVGDEFEAYLKINNGKKNLLSFWFADWQAEGSKLKYYPAREFGPILFAQHTLSKGVMKMTAQMPPIADSDSQHVSLEIKDSLGNWVHLGKEKIDPMARTATFKVQDWDDQHNVPYRLSYPYSVNAGKVIKFFFDGIVHKDPLDKFEIIVAGFTGNNDLGFPNNELVKHIKTHKPDVLFFSGDQIYESVGGYGYITSPLDKACLDYLRKWYLYGWEYRELLRTIPTVSIPDDHDVYHGNIWGEGGKAASKKGDRKDRQDSGGYIMSAEWINMVQRTQTSHLPDPYDPTPVKQNIGVYYTDMTYGGVSFAIIEDRKFKSAPKNFLPKSAKVKNGWAENPLFRDPQKFNVSGAQLLGERQMVFLEDWVQDWTNNVWMKVLLSQTIFSTVATLPDSAISDVVVPKLRISEKGFYPKNDRPTQDMDSNGWPKVERDRVLRILRKGFAVHLAGDQHLGSTIQYGVESWGDASFALCVPSVSNYFPRRWFPRESPIDWVAGKPRNIGKFYDGFGNLMTIHAVANPYFTGMKPSSLYDRAAGYGIVKMNKLTREIEMTNWPRQVDPSQVDARPYRGWPITINQLDNYGREAVVWLPKLEFINASSPVIHLIEEKNGKIVYALRIVGSEFSPKVFSKGLYTIRISYDEKEKEITGIESFNQKDVKSLEIEL
jgi:alkaline phosphatase D